VTLLREYLTDSNSEVCVLASEALHTLLRTKEGRKTLETTPMPENLHPFRYGAVSKAPFVQVNDVKFLSTMHELDIWCPKSRTTHFAWITNLTSCIVKNISFPKTYTEQLVRLCQLKEEFAEAILPPLILFVLSHEDCQEMVMQQLSYFFNCHFEKRASLKNKSNYVWGNIKSVECMLNVVHFLRLNMSDTLQHLNLLHVAQAAQFCSAHFSCIYYAELSGLDKKFLSGGRMRSVEQICNDTETGRAMHENLFNSYKSIAESDAIYGCGMSRLLDEHSQERYLEHTKQWDKVLLLQDLNSAGPSAMPQRMAPALLNLGLHNLLKANLETQSDERMQDAQLHCCWRLGQWDKPTILDLSQEKNASFESSRYSALKSLMLMDESGLQLSLDLAKKAVIATLKQSNLESMRTVYDALSQLQMTQEILDIAVGSVEEVLDKWRLQNEKSMCAFEHLEPIMEQRLCLLNLTQTSQFDMTDDGLRLLTGMADLQLKLSKIARAEKSFHVAERALHALTKTALTINQVFSI
jgi:FAT domain